MESDDSSRPENLLAELTGLHDMLSEPVSDDNAIPVLQDIVEPAITTGRSLQPLRPLLMQSAEGLLQEVIRDFAPQITAELEKRLHQHLEQLIREQEQLRHSQQQAQSLRPQSEGTPQPSSAPYPPTSPYQSME